jgi:hypothetical protein
MPDRFPNPIRRPLGRAIVRTPAQRDEAARITDADVTRARLAWPLWAPMGFEALIEATAQPPKEQR